MGLIKLQKRVYHFTCGIFLRLLMCLLALFQQHRLQTVGTNNCKTF
jgi:hypothetical protein